MATDDLTLVKRVRSGDQRAFKLLVERYQRKIYGVALGMLRDKEEALDVSQEAFVKVYRYLEHFKGDSSFYTWLYRITANICIDIIRRRGGAREQVELDEGQLLDTAQANIGALGTRLGTNPQKSALRKELADKIQEALEQLPEKHRAILLLREIEGGLSNLEGEEEVRTSKRLGPNMLFNWLHRFRSKPGETALDKAKWDRLSFGALMFLIFVTLVVIVLVAL